MVDRKEEAAVAGGDRLLGFKAASGCLALGKSPPHVCLRFPSYRMRETRQPALRQPLRTRKDPTGLPHLRRGSRNILQPVRALGRPGLGAGVSVLRAAQEPGLHPRSFSRHTTLAGGRGLRSIPGGPWGTPWRQADIFLRVLRAPTRAPAASSWGQRLLPPWHPRRRALPNSVNPLMLVTMRPQGRWQAVSMETQTCLGPTGRGGELTAGFSKGLLELQPKREQATQWPDACL